jgi:protein-S-isoprenylcysteine O-methyltransferase Ste14
MLRRLLVPLVVVVFLAGCNQISEPVPNATRLAQSKWFIGVAVIGLLLAAWASWRMGRDSRIRHKDRRKRHANNRNRN